MAVTREEVLQIAELARLQLTATEVDQFLDELNDILTHVEELRTLPIETAELAESITEGAAPRRSDELGPDLLRFPVAELAPGWDEGFFTVPRLAALDMSELEEPFEDKARLESEGRPDEESVLGGGG
jgi:aspartyl-tRNA(Asn)/glutamyl-tRNA(Gln) amidotransferase subunit C